MYSISETTFFDRPTSIEHESGVITFGAFTVVEASKNAPVHFLGNARIGHQCYFSKNDSIKSPIVISNDVYVDSGCRIGADSKIGERTQVLYGATIFETVEIGSECIIGSDVSNWTRIDDRVTFFGTVVHSNRKVEDMGAWNTDPHPAPHIKSDAFIGEASLLIGGIEIGQSSYVTAGEIVRSNIEAESIFVRGKLFPLSRFKNFIST
ncbi:hypothetical protein DZK27_16735 [Rhodobacteraceae bacterium 63075]|nr:hypothetical protein DZK27_16735 [Rhodobacteraceae bacterium 63075]